MHTLLSLSPALHANHFPNPYPFPTPSLSTSFTPLLPTLIVSSTSSFPSSQSAEATLRALNGQLAAVRKAGKELAHYFCDNRDNFLEYAFVEIKHFSDEFSLTVKVSPYNNC